MFADSHLEAFYAFPFFLPLFNFFGIPSRTGDFLYIKNKAVCF